MAFFPRFAGFIAILLAVATLSACTTSSRVVRTYDGDALNRSNIAMLIKPSEIEIEQIDGKPMKSFVMDSVSMSYELLPGQHTVAFRSKSLWAVPGRKEIGEKNAEEIRSELQQISFSAEAGRTYEIQPPKPRSRDEAVQLAAAYKTRLVDEKANTVATSTAYVAAAQQSKGESPAPSVTAPASAPVAAEPSVSSATLQGATGVGNTPKIDALKGLWEGATSEERQEFLRWVFQQK